MHQQISGRYFRKKKKKRGTCTTDCILIVHYCLVGLDHTSYVKHSSTVSSNIIPLSKHRFMAFLFLQHALSWIRYFAG